MAKSRYVALRFPLKKALSRSMKSKEICFIVWLKKFPDSLNRFLRLFGKDSPTNLWFEKLLSLKTFPFDSLIYCSYRNVEQIKIFEGISARLETFRVYKFSSVDSDRRSKLLSSVPVVQQVHKEKELKASL